MLNYLLIKFENGVAQLFVRVLEQREVHKGFVGCCQTNRLKHQKPEERAFYEAIRERHSVRAASRFTLKVVRVDIDFCELNRL